VPADDGPIDILPGEQGKNNDRTDGREQLIDINNNNTHQIRRPGRTRIPSAAGAAIQGIEIVARTQKAVQEAKDSAIRTRIEIKNPQFMFNKIMIDRRNGRKD
jgi:hypothetical protein